MTPGDLVRALDAQTRERVTADVLADRTPPERGIGLVGSYARMDYLLDMWKRGRIPHHRVLELLPTLWPGSDPDDTDRRFIELWRIAWLDNERRPVTDGDPLPEGRVHEVYRGQERYAPMGCAWSLDIEAAARFAAGAGERGPLSGPVVLTSRVHRRMVYAYLTRRGESEVILDPDHLPLVAVAT